MPAANAKAFRQSSIYLIFTFYFKVHKLFFRAFALIAGKLPAFQIIMIQKMKKFSAMLFVLAMLLQTTPSVYAQQAMTAKAEKNAEMNAKIRKEAMENSQIMRTMHFLTDVYGPRLTGSPNLKMAGEWAVKTMKEWKFDNAYLDPWDFGNPGWANERAAGFITAPVKDSLVFEVLAWTPSTKGVVKAEAVQLEFPRGITTQAELDAFFNANKSKINGKIVLLGTPADVKTSFEEPAKRRDAEDLKKYFDPDRVEQPRPMPPPRPTPDPSKLSFSDVIEQFDQFLIDNKVPVRIDDARRPHGQIRAFNNRSFDVNKTVPTIVLRNEDYGRIWRILDDKTSVMLEFDIQNKVYPEGATSYNVIGEIAGTDKKDEVIMLGGHLDSWHAATGATDNAIGCAIMLEAARILKTLDVKPRRTIRVALWGGEEQGLLGSQAYVEKVFGSFENPTANYNKFGGYFNIDSGTGRARGFSVFGPPEAGQVLREIAAPFSDLGVVGATITNSRGLGGSDYTSFNKAGLPGISVVQDPIEYFSHTWHTNLDTYERIVEDDVKASAAVVAWAVYELAMRDELLPRMSKDKMPAER